MRMSKLTDLLLADAYIGGGSGGGGGGETWTETLLWENPTRQITNDTDFSSDAFEEMDMIRIHWVVNSAVSEQEERDSYFDREEMYPASGNGYLGVGVYGYSYYVRSITHFRADKVLRIGKNLYKIGNTGVSTNTSQNVPLAIYGIKKG